MSRPSAGARAVLGYRPELDGVRAFAVLTVVFFHSQGMLPDALGLRGGFIGVDVFFVLSGFLITSLLISERRSTERVSLPLFWLRRALRILPALLVMAGFVLVLHRLTGVAYPDSRPLGEALAHAFSFVSNWNHPMRNGIVGHTWSLAIEEQFYVVWPLVFALAIRRPRSVRAMSAVMFVSAVGVVALRLALLSAGEVESASFWTISRGEGVFLGAGLALLLADPHPMLRRMLRPAAIGVLAVGGLILASAGCDRVLTPYQCGLPIATISTTLLIAHLTVVPAGLIGRPLSIKPLRAVGRTSYGIYLFHWPLAVWMTSWTPLDRTGARFAVFVAATAAVVVPSYLLIERPIMRSYPWLASAGERRRSRVRRPLVLPRLSGVRLPALGAAMVTVIAGGIWFGSVQGGDTPPTTRVVAAADVEQDDGGGSPEIVRTPAPVRAVEPAAPTAAPDPAAGRVPAAGTFAVLAGPGGCGGVQDALDRSRSVRADAARAQAPLTAQSDAVLDALPVDGYRMVMQGPSVQMPQADWRSGYRRQWQDNDIADPGFIEITVDEFASTEAAMAETERSALASCATVTETFVLREYPSVIGYTTQVASSAIGSHATFVTGTRRFVVTLDLIDDPAHQTIATIASEQFSRVS